MVFFDGEKRVYAHRTYQKIRARIALAAFDDSRLLAFHRYLDGQNETWWETAHEPLYKPMLERMASHGHGRDAAGTAFVVGGAWRAASTE